MILAKKYAGIGTPGLFLRCRLYQLAPSLHQKLKQVGLNVHEVIWFPASEKASQQLEMF